MKNDNKQHLFLRSKIRRLGSSGMVRFPCKYQRAVGSFLFHDFVFKTKLLISAPHIEVQTSFAAAPFLTSPIISPLTCSMPIPAVPINAVKGCKPLRPDTAAGQRTNGCNTERGSFPIACLTYPKNGPNVEFNEATAVNMSAVYPSGRVALALRAGFVGFP